MLLACGALSAAASTSEPNGPLPDGIDRTAELPRFVEIDETRGASVGSHVTAAPRAGVDNIMYITRTGGCGIFGGFLTVTRTVNGVTTVVGTMDFVVYRFVYMAQSSTTAWASQIQVSPTIVIGESGFSWPVTAGDQGTGTPSWTVFFKPPTTQNTASLTWGSAPTVRCDQALPGSASIGCVVPAVPADIYYDYSELPEYGRHLLDAEFSGLPGSRYSGAPLHRQTDQNLIAANRNTACPTTLPRPTGKSCDEYPVASTREGGVHGWRDRADLHLVSDLDLSGRYHWAQGYSACMIDTDENSTAGSRLNKNLYVPLRVLDGDAFYASVI
jgi:hypothetical protein